MNPQASNQYLKMKVMTATPEQLQLLLYDGAIRFCEQARLALEKKEYSESFDRLTRAQRILAELLSSLRFDVLPDLCRKMSSLYNFVYRKLIEANTEHSIASLDEAVRILKYQRETWALLLDQLGKERAGQAAKGIDMPAPDSRMESIISTQG
jgi:flagellar protein FliS